MVCLNALENLIKQVQPSLELKCCAIETRAVFSVVALYFFFPWEQKCDINSCAQQKTCEWASLARKSHIACIAWCASEEGICSNKFMFHERGFLSIYITSYTELPRPNSPAEAALGTSLCSGRGRAASKGRTSL